MAYSKFVTWNNPKDAGVLPIGRFGLTYTRVIVDLPYYQGSRQYWADHDVFVNSNGDSIIDLQTSIPYDPASIKVYIDGKAVAFTKTIGASQRDFSVQGSALDGKAIHCEYIPRNIALYLGDQRNQLEKVYGVVCSVESSVQIRDTIQTIRKHIITFCDRLDIQKPLWYGGFANKDVGAYNNLVAGITEASVALHLREIQDIFENVIITVNNMAGKTIAYSKTPAFTISYLEFVQEALTLADAALEEVG